MGRTNSFGERGNHIFFMVMPPSLNLCNGLQSEPCRRDGGTNGSRKPLACLSGQSGDSAAVHDC